MPTYEYQCRSCGHRFDAVQKITAPARTRCPHCRKKVDRLISAGAGFLFKGSGFYTTDHRSKPYQDAAKKDQAGGDGASLPAKIASKESRPEVEKTPRPSS
jgi:putative FmdB family regulatory protein